MGTTLRTPEHQAGLNGGEVPRPLEKTPVSGVVNAMTVDVEDYFQVSALEPHIPRSSWERIPCRIEPAMDRILQLFDEAGIKATFFFLG